MCRLLKITQTQHTCDEDCDNINTKSVQRVNKLTSHVDFVLIFYKPQRVLLNVLLRKHLGP